MYELLPTRRNGDGAINLGMVRPTDMNKTMMYKALCRELSELLVVVEFSFPVGFAARVAALSLKLGSPPKSSTGFVVEFVNFFVAAAVVDVVECFVE